MTLDDMAEVAGILSAGWETIRWDGERLARWQRALGDLPGVEAIDAARRWLATQKRAPKPADIREACASMRPHRPEADAVRCEDCGTSGWRDVVVAVGETEYPAVVPCGCATGRERKPHVGRVGTTVILRPTREELQAAGGCQALVLARRDALRQETESLPF